MALSKVSDFIAFLYLLKPFLSHSITTDNQEQMAWQACDDDNLLNGMKWIVSTDNNLGTDLKRWKFYVGMKTAHLYSNTFYEQKFNYQTETITITNQNR